MRKSKKRDDLEVVDPSLLAPVEEMDFAQLIDTDYIRYAWKTTQDRALADARDGLKPVQRRILYAMRELGLGPASGYKKCARVVGDTMGLYHPHGDQALYQTMVRMAQDWVMSCPLIDPQGNFGAIDSNAKQAAMRYTECRLSRFGDEMMRDLSPDSVDWQPNYNDELMEPMILPSVFPNLLVNGTSGIAVSLASNMPPHNLSEVTALVQAYIARGGKLSVDEIVAILPGPDFPTGGKILGQKGVRDYVATGRGSVVNEGIYEVEDLPKGGYRIVITQLPYNAAPDRLALEIRDLVQNKEIDGIEDLKDLSKKTDVKVVVVLSKGANPQLVVNKLLQKTCLRQNFAVNSTVLVGDEIFANMPLLDLVKVFVDHRKEVLTRQYTAERERASARIHVLDGLISVSRQIDRVIAIIRASDDPASAALGLIEAGLVQTTEQAKAVLAITLSKLTRLEAAGLEQEQTKLRERVAFLDGVLGSERKLLGVISREQAEIAKRLGSPRRTQIAEEAAQFSREELVPEEQIVVSMTKDGYIKRIPLAAYRLQGRGVKGVQAVKSREGDEPSDIFVMSTHDHVLFFTNLGLCYRRRGHELPVGQRAGKGTHLANVLRLQANEKVTGMLPIGSFDQDGYILMVTVGGLIKRSAIRAYDTQYKNRGIQAIELTEGDQLAFTEVTTGGQDVFIATAGGKAVRYSESLVRATGRATQGVKAIRLTEGDRIAQLLVLDPKDSTDVLVVTERGYGKRTPSSEYRVRYGRDTIGVATIDRVKADTNGLIVGAVAVKDEDTLLVLTGKGNVAHVPVAKFRAVGRAAMGVRAVKIDDAADSVVSIAKVREGNPALDSEEGEELARPVLAFGPKTAAAAS